MIIPKVLLAADNDRDMLEYLHEAFQTQVNVCDQCGHEEPTSTCDSASDLKDYLGHFPAPPKPIYDEAKEREVFEAEFPVPEGLVFDQDRNQYYGAPTYWLQQAQWEAWQKCAQSRAKSVEVGDE